MAYRPNQPSERNTRNLTSDAVLAQQALISDAQRSVRSTPQNGRPKTTRGRTSGKAQKMIEMQAISDEKDADDFLDPSYNVEVVDLSQIAQRWKTPTALPTTWTGWLCFVIVMLLLVLLAGTQITSFTFSIITNAQSYLKNAHVTKNGHNVYWHQESRSDLLAWGSPTSFDVLDILNPRGKYLLAQNAEIDTVWLRNYSSSRKYYNCDTVLTELNHNLTNTYLVVQPAQLTALVALSTTHRRNAQTYQTPFVNFLSTLNQNITGLEASYNNLSLANPCRGKPYEATTTAALGVQTLLLHDTQYVGWSTLTQQPVTTVANFANGMTSANVTTILKGVYNVAVTTMFAVPAYGSVTVTTTIMIDLQPFSTCYSTQPNITIPSSTFVQCTANGLLQLNSNSSIAIHIAYVAGTATSVSTTLSTRMQIQRICKTAQSYT